MAELFPNQGGFDADSVPEDEFDGGCLPPGEYVVRITKSDIQNTKAGDGKYIVLEFTVDEGEFANRKFWSNLNIVNKNPVAKKIADQQLAKIMKACGVPSPLQDTEQLHNIPFRAITKIQKSDQYDDKTELKSAKPYNADASPTPKPASTFTKKNPAQTTKQEVDDEVPW